jgi:TonB family protein
MNTLITFLQINLFLVVFFGFYWLILRKETFYQLNRLYLWMAVLFSFLLPFLKIETIKSWFVTERIQEAVYTASLPEAFVITSTVDPVFKWYEFLEYGYLFVVFILSLRLIFNIYTSYSVTKSSDFIENNAFSFFGNTCVDSSLIESETIQYHEEIHSKQMHYLDLLLIEMVAIVLWINPVVYILKKQMSFLHEFIADFHASQISNSKTDYATLLFSHQFKSSPDFIFIQPFFNQSILKLRIMMLFKKPSTNFAILKYCIIAPIFIGITVISSLTFAKKSDIIDLVEPVSEKVISFSKPQFKITSQPLNVTNLKIAKDTLIKSKGESKEVIFTAVEQNPEFPGGMTAMYRFLGNNIKYPNEAQRARVSGRVFLKFVVEKDGSISSVDVLKGIGFGCDAEAIRVVKSMPKWIPGRQNGKPVRVYYNMPIVFKLENAKGQRVGSTTDLNEIVVVGYEPKNSSTNNQLPLSTEPSNHLSSESKLKSNFGEALIFVNGMEVEDKKISDIDVNNIENVRVIKSQEALKTYGERAKKGVILIETKKN